MMQSPDAKSRRGNDDGCLKAPRNRITSPRLRGEVGIEQSENAG
jgi:hypothetical protein